MRFGILGSLRVSPHDREVALRPRERALLAMLLLNAGRTVSTNQLVDAVWGERPPQSARSQLQGLVHRLRVQLAGAGDNGQLIVTEPGGYRISIDPAAVDVTEFRRLVAQARTDAVAGRHREATAGYRTALALWRGPALAAISSDRIRRAAAALDEERTQALEECLDAELTAGRSGELISELTDLVQQHPHRERLHRALMLALYRAGRQADALVAFRRVRELLRDELGTDPGVELQRLHQAVLNRDPALDSAPQPVASGSVSPPRELPADVAHFTGRVETIKALDELVSHPGSTGPVVISAVAGTAGVGKTALVVHWAHRAADRFPDGQLFLNLRGYGSDQPMESAEALARLLTSLGVAGPDIPAGLEDRAARYRSAVAGRRMLILLDNAATAEQVRPLLPGSPTCAVAVTSRDSLSGLVAFHGANRLVLDVLPPAEAVMLLRLLIGPRADAEPEAVTMLAEQCARLPLALRVAAELAASHRGRPLAELARELSDQQRRLDLLEAGDDPHAAVRVVFSWSVRHLPAEVALTFRRLGLHPGLDFDPYAAAAVAGTSVAHAQDALDRLVRAHLVQSTDRRRYGMHDLLRAYAVDLATTEDTDQERTEARDRLLDYYLATAAAAMDFWYPAETHRRPRVPPPATAVPDLADPDTARAWLETNRPRLVAVAAHAATHGRPIHAIRLSTTLFRYLQVGGHYIDALVIHGHARRAAEQVGDIGEQAHTLRYLGATQHQLGRLAAAGEYLRQALAMFGKADDQDGLATVLNNLGVTEERLGRHRSALDHYRRALEVFRRIGELSGVANTLNGLGVIEERLGNHGQAADHYREAIAICQQIGNRLSEAIALHNLGNVEEKLGNYPAATDRHRHALAMFQELGNPQGQAHAFDSLGNIQVRLGHPERATEHYEQALALFRDIGDRDGEAQALHRLGEVERAIGDHAAALTHYTEALVIATAGGLRDLEARAHHGLGHTYRALADHTRARTHYERAQSLYTELGMPEATEVRASLSSLAEATEAGHSRPRA